MDKVRLFSRLDDYCHQRFVELGERRLSNPILKSYVIETSRDCAPPITDFSAIGDLSQIDDDLHQLTDSSGEVGWIESRDRFLIFYTFMKTSEIETTIKRVIRDSMSLDNLWLSGGIFDSLFKIVTRTVTSPHRFVRIGMEFQPLFEAVADISRRDAEQAELFDEERRALNRLSLSNPIDEIQHDIDVLQLLPKFRNMSMLRFPSRTAAGGHEFYYFGKITNRSDDFYDHRQTVVSVLDSYRKATETIEDTVWMSVETTKVDGHTAVKGSAVLFDFQVPLTEQVFFDFMDATFRRMIGPFRLWGNPLRRGKTTFHVYGLDLHLGQRIFLELSPQRFIAVLPQGTCGNTIHRLVTNIQRYLTPRFSVTLGDRQYKDLIEEAF